LVAVITGFDTRTNKPVTAAWSQAAVKAAIRVEFITVIADLIAIFTDRDIGPTNPITAARDRAVVPAQIDVRLVSIVTSFIAWRTHLQVATA
jgi:hypothetical protein